MRTLQECSPVVVSEGSRSHHSGLDSVTTQKGWGRSPTWSGASSGFVENSQVDATDASLTARSGLQIREKRAGKSRGQLRQRSDGTIPEHPRQQVKGDMLVCPRSRLVVEYETVQLDILEYERDGGSRNGTFGEQPSPAVHHFALVHVSPPLRHLCDKNNPNDDKLNNYQSRVGLARTPGQENLYLSGGTVHAKPRDPPRHFRKKQ